MAIKGETCNFDYDKEVRVVKERRIKEALITKTYFQSSTVLKQFNGLME